MDVGSLRLTAASGTRRTLVGLHKNFVSRSEALVSRSAFVQPERRDSALITTLIRFNGRHQTNPVLTHGNSVAGIDV